MCVPWLGLGRGMRLQPYLDTAFTLGYTVSRAGYLGVPDRIKDCLDDGARPYKWVSFPYLSELYAKPAYISFAV